MRTTTTMRAALLCSVIALPAAQAAPALEESPIEVPEQTLEERIAELEQQVAILSRRNEAAAKDDAAAKVTTPVIAAVASGFSLTSRDQAYQLKIRGYMQADSHFLFDDHGQAVDTFQMRRVRPIIEGTIDKLFAFRFMADFGLGRQSVQDAYIDANFDRQFKLRFGKFKPPVGLERLQSGSELKWVERGFPTNLVPNRDVGVQAFGDLFDGTVSYAAGWFNGVPDGGSGDVDGTDPKEWAARVMFQPFINGTSPLQNLSFGVSDSFGDKKATGDLPRFVSPVQATFFSFKNTVLAQGQTDRISPQVTWNWQQFGLLGEYVRSSIRVSTGANAKPREQLTNDAWQAVGIFVLTGEEARFGNINPTHPFTLGGDGWGAIELLARAGQLNVDNNAFTLGFADNTTAAESAQSWAAGINWYLNRNIKASLDYEHTTFDGGAKNNQDRPDEKVLFTRVQVSW